MNQWEGDLIFRSTPEQGRLKEVGTTSVIEVEGAFSVIRPNPDVERKHLDSGYMEKL